jgi:hypothetical protein
MPVWRVLIRQPHISPQGFVFSAPIIAALLKYNIELLAHFYFLKHSRGRTALGISPIQVATWHSMPHLRRSLGTRCSHLPALRYTNVVHPDGNLGIYRKRSDTR